MRVLIHTDEYSPTAQACTNRMRSFSDALMAAGADVTVICSKGNLENGTPRLGPEKVIYAPAFRMRKKTAARRLLNNITFGISSFLCALGVGKIDAVITTSPPPLVSLSGWLITKVKKSKLIYDVRDIWPDVALEMGSFSETSIYCRMFRKVTAFMYQHADLITTVSPGKLEKIKNYCHLKENCGDRLLLISNGFDENVSKSPIDERIAEKFDLRKAPCCVYIGNIGLAQGLDALLRLAAETSHREVRFFGYISITVSKINQNLSLRKIFLHILKYRNKTGSAALKLDISTVKGGILRISFYRLDFCITTDDRKFILPETVE